MATERYHLVIRHFNKKIQLSKWLLCLSETLQKSCFQWKYQFWDTIIIKTPPRPCLIEIGRIMLWIYLHTILILSISEFSHLIYYSILSGYLFTKFKNQLTQIQFDDNYVRLTVFPPTKWHVKSCFENWFIRMHRYIDTEKE
jgi:hypothetical protein